jgi:hypothetical protein
MSWCQPCPNSVPASLSRAAIVAGAGAGVKKSHEQELGAKQEKQDAIPLRDFSRRGIAYRKKYAKAEAMRVIG